MPSEPSLFDDDTDAGRPLAHRLRPGTLDAVLGQEHLLGPGKPLRRAIERGEIGSMVLWGPPGCGKTTLARLIANHTDSAFETFSAVTEGVPRVREILREAERRRAAEGRATILFCDEIHRFNKAQQDAFLPHVEEGLITLIGATTENPSFELNSALLSRLRVFVLKPLDAAAIASIVARGFERLAADTGLRLEPAEDALDLLVRHADGDARRALNVTEAVFGHARAVLPEGERRVTAELVTDVLERRIPQYDKHGEQHYNLISALHKAVRGSDVEGALYWLARMIDGGEDPLYIARRVVRMASEDIGLADPRALSLALSAKEAYDFLGSPEGELAIAEAVIYLATAPKSNRAYVAWGEALRAAREHPAEPVPLHIRNAPTRLMKEIGYGQGYRYDHDEGGLAAGQEYLPEPLRGQRWYEPTEHGFEKQLAERIEWWARQKKLGRAKSAGTSTDAHE
ncbi:MAG TPA: replication-associated recombination protein A [Gammaproteobacteria bacterium]|nr:replication-associated recombination protein A [Gammaproteobacteria bacterium]